MAEGIRDELLSSYLKTNEDVARKILKCFTEEKKGIVYKLICDKCGASYFGETRFDLLYARSDMTRKINYNQDTKKVIQHFYTKRCKAKCFHFEIAAWQPDNDERKQLKRHFIIKYHTDDKDNLNTYKPRKRDIYYERLQHYQHEFDGTYIKIKEGKNTFLISKDKVEGIVFKLTCDKCGASYIGETMYSLQQAEKDMTRSICKAKRGENRKVVFHFYKKNCSKKEFQLEFLAWQPDRDKRVNLKIVYIIKYDTIDNGLNTIELGSRDRDLYDRYMRQLQKNASKFIPKK